MNPKFETIRQQLHRNAVALISLVVAVSSLGYNTWRNETTETQRNLRAAAFEVVSHLGELSAQVNQLGYGESAKDVAWNRGWGHVLSLQTLGRLLPKPAAAEIDALAELWQRNVSLLRDGDRTAIRDVREQIDQAAAAVIAVIESLDCGALSSRAVLWVVGLCVAASRGATS